MVRGYSVTEKFKDHSLKRATFFVVSAFFGMSLTQPGSIFGLIGLVIFGLAQIYLGLILYAKYWNYQLNPKPDNNAERVTK